MTAALVILSSVGLLAVRLSDYDDSILLVGTRLVRAGELPYVGFYSHYGPLGYSLIGLFQSLVEGPGLALRLAQSIVLAGLGAIAHALARGLAVSRAETGIPLAVLALSTAVVFPSFLGFAFAIASLGLFIAARTARSSATGRILAMVGGSVLSAAALVRPAFGMYVVVAITSFELVCRISSGNGLAKLDRLSLFLVAALTSGFLLWIVLYRPIPIRVAFDSAIRRPAHLMDRRYLEPDFLRGGKLMAIVACATVSGSNLFWGFAIPKTRTRGAAVLLLVVCAVFPVMIRAHFRTQPLSWYGSLLIAFPLLLAFAERRTLRESSDIAAAALFGVASAAFGHYAWSRPDAPHLLPSLCLAACGVALLWKRFIPIGRIALLVLFVGGWLIASRSWNAPILPVARLWKGDLPRFEMSRDERRKIRWGCEEISDDAVRAVSLADRYADPASRFVAVASTQASTQGNPVLLFLISTRLPYTKWFQYDPGLQTSPPVQKEMVRELNAARSETAVVWRADRFLYDGRPIRVGSTSPFDEAFSRMYPHTLGRFGDYEVRGRRMAPLGSK